MSIIYTGLFLRTNIEGRLEKHIAVQHITHEFRPAVIRKDLFGQTATVRVIGYGVDNDNEGYLVELVNASEELVRAFQEIDTPHITLSVSMKGKPVNTRDLYFHLMPISFTLECVYGGFDGQRVVTE